MPVFRGFTVSFNSIGAGKTVKKYLLLASSELLTPLLLPANRNMIEAKCSCQLLINTRSLFRRGAMDTWVKYQLVIVVAPTLSKHAQAKRMIEKILPGSVMLEEYRDTANTRVQCNEFIPDNKFLVFSFQRTGITHHKFGEVYDLRSPTAPFKDKETNRPIHAPWHVSKRERNGIFLPTKNFPLERKLNMIGLLDMLLLGVDREMERDKRASGSKTPVGENLSNTTAAAVGGRVANNRSNNYFAPSDAFGIPRKYLSRRRPSSASGLRQQQQQQQQQSLMRRDRAPSVSFGLI